MTDENPCSLTRRHCATAALEIGVDEVGRGALFGPVCTAAVVVPDDMPFLLNKQTVIKDSKKLSKLQRERLYDFILEHATYVETTLTPHTVIDDRNILHATMESMHDSIAKVLTAARDPTTTHLIIDGTYFEPFRWGSGALEIPYTCVPQGDSKYLSVACASIIAKVTRDRWIAEMVAEHPEWKERYGLHSNMGYGAKVHMNGIREHGITEYHRKSFAPCSGELDS